MTGGTCRGDGRHMCAVARTERGSNVALKCLSIGGALTIR